MIIQSKRKSRFLFIWLFGVFGIGLTFSFAPIVYGWYLTYQYTPDLLEVYQDVNVLQNEVVFGTINRGFPLTLAILILIAILIFTVVLYALLL